MRFVYGYVTDVDEAVALAFREAGNLDFEISRCLQSAKYTLCAEASHPSQVSQKMSQLTENATVETDVTGENTPRINNGNKPAFPCSADAATRNLSERNYSGCLIPEMGDPPDTLITAGNGKGAQLTTPHCRICIPAMLTANRRLL